MRGTITLTILGAIGGAVVDAHDRAVAILSAGYGASGNKISRAMREVKHSREKLTASRDEQVRYYNMLAALRRDGLIAEQRRGGKRLFGLTRKGMTRLHALRTKAANPMPATEYTGGVSDVFTIVAFDVPERDRRKRDWLREALRNLHLRMVQKSVWMGKVKLPKTFIDDLSHLHLTEHVEIFEITKRGSLKHLM